MSQKSLKQVLKNKQPTTGAWLLLCNSLSAEIMSLAGFDWLLIDMEHGYGDYQTLLSQLQAMQAGNAVPIVRVQWNDHVIIKRVLDMGAQGVMIPSVSTQAECELAVKACKYPPKGIRGIGPFRAAQYQDITDYLKQANDQITVIIQIETKAGVENIQSIVETPGVDVIFIGPNDLAASLGHLGNLSHPDVLAAITKIETATKNAGVTLATISNNWAEAKSLYQRGYQMLTLCSDMSMIGNQSKELLTAFHKDIRS